MPPRSLVNLILLVLIGIVAAFLLIDDKGRQSTRQLASLDTGTIDSISVERRDSPDLEFRKSDDDWHIIKPVRLRARPARIKAILNLPVTPSHDRMAAATASLESMLLSPPLLVVRLGEHPFEFGGTDPIDDRRYVLVGDTVHLVDDRLFPQLSQPVSFYTDTRLLPGNAAITQITYPDHVLLLESDRWLSRPGPVAPGTGAAMVVQNWRSAEAQRVLPYRGNQSQGRVVIKTPDEVIIFDVLPTGHGVNLARAGLGIQYQLSKETATELGLAEYIHE